jgi:hypothetical protein
VFVDGGVAYSNFLRRAAVPNYWTPSLAVGLMIGPSSSIRIGYTGDFGKRYNNSGGEAVLVVAY